MRILEAAIVKGTFIFSDSQAAVKAADSCKISLRLVWDCHQSVMMLAEHSKVHLLWVPGHKELRLMKLWTS
jgi:hypothetical protein